MLLKLKKLAHRLSIYILDFDVNTAQSRRSFRYKRSTLWFRAWAGCCDSYAEIPPEMKGSYESLDRGVSKSIFLRSQFLSLSEKWSLALLSFASIVAFLIATNRSPNWYADL